MDITFGKEIGATFLLYNDILDGTVLGVVLLRCRIFSTKEWRACLDASWVLDVWNEIASPRG